MTLLRLENVSLAYGHLPLLAGVDLQIEPGERVCLVGRNGAGKSSLMRIISGATPPDEGEVWRQAALRIGHLEQEVPGDAEESIFETVAVGLGELGRLLAEYHQAVHQAGTGNKIVLERLAFLQARIEALNGWNIHLKVETVLTRLGLAADQRLADCSGGIRRQVMLARALVAEPDLLLLDEPTNHLDIAAITWLEKFLLAARGALIFVTHDRTFVRRLATRIIDLDRGRLTSFPGDFDHYLRKKEELLEIEARASAKFDKKLAEEEVWIRRGIKARRTRNEGRVRALRAMRLARSQRIEATGKARFGIDAGALSGKLVADLRNVSFRYGDRLVLRDLSAAILRGDRVGIIGPNGCGKTTLLRLILGEVAPTEGEVVRGTRLEVAYFDQQRGRLDPEKSVRENMGDTDYIAVKGRSRHVVGYLKDFLFPPARVDSPVKALSGGERNRLLLAKIFARSVNMMVLDEPTNDLDVDTLELLEDLLADYEGTLLLVSHDRAFLDNVVTSTLVFEGDGKVGDYVGGYEDWELRQTVIAERSVEPARSPAEAVPAPRPPAIKRKLSYKEQRELEGLPGRIEALEAEQSELHRVLSEPEFHRQSRDRISAALERLAAVGRELEDSYARWECLEER